VGQKIRFYADEHVPRAIIRGLRERGIDVLTVSDAGLLRASDEEHLQFANSQGRVLITQDSDFLRFHALGLPHAGIVYVLHESSIGETIRGLMLVYQVLEAKEMHSHVEYL
jgi:predicted nuclease of predicted toxin-antitoxin system